MNAQRKLDLPTAARRIETPLGWFVPGLADFELRLVIPGRIVPKKNHLKPIRVGRAGRIAPDSVYTAWERSAWAALVEQWAPVFREPIPKHIEVALTVIAYLPNRSRWPDLAACFEGPQDVLEAHRPTCDLRVGVRNGLPKCRKHAGVITNDSQVCGYPLDSDRRVDKANPRTEIILRPYRRTP